MLVLAANEPRASGRSSSLIAFLARGAGRSDDRLPLVKFVFDQLRRDDLVVVLPKAEHTPALRHRDRLVLCVPLTIGEQLPTPQLGVRPRQLGVLLAEVPEAPVDEDSDPCTWKHEVGSNTAPTADAPVDEEPSPSAVQLTTQGEFGRCVSPTEAAHVPPTSVVCFPGLHAPILA